MEIVDRGLSARRVQERLERTEDPRERAMLTTVCEHLRAEADVDVDRLVSTLSDQPNYHLWNAGRDIGPDDYESVLAYYQDLVAVKRHILEFDIERIVVDHDTVVTEGWIRALNLGTVARARGWLVDDDDATYLVTQRVVIFWPFDAEGKMTGEDGYLMAPGSWPTRNCPTPTGSSSSARAEPSGCHVQARRQTDPDAPLRTGQ
jgi:hypothetical protein